MGNYFPVSNPATNYTFTTASQVAGIIAALIYLSAPYRFVNLYARGSLGETIAFAIPLMTCATVNVINLRT